MIQTALARCQLGHGRLADSRVSMRHGLCHRHTAVCAYPEKLYNG